MSKDQHPGQLVEWDMTFQDYEKLKELLFLIQDYSEESDEYAMLRESIRSLPNYPEGQDPLRAHFVLNVTSRTVH